MDKSANLATHRRGQITTNDEGAVVSEYAREELRRTEGIRESALTIGNFDGIHLGHQHLIREVIDRAHASGLAAGAVTLYPDPVRVLRPDQPMQYLTSLEERLELLRGLGLDIVVPLSFTSELAELSPATFISLLSDELKLRLLIMGPDNTFGRNREATPERIAELGREHGFAVEVLASPFSSNDSPVSATSIRAALATGDIASVSRQLGRAYSLRGPVVAGERRGRLLGFPTANLSVTPDRALPAAGVYATWARLGESRYPSATNIGMRPTFAGQHLSVETHIFDFSDDIYDQTLQIEFVAQLRPEAKFSGPEALKTQIDLDVAQARVLLASVDDRRG